MSWKKKNLHNWGEKIAFVYHSSDSANDTVILNRLHMCMFHPYPSIDLNFTFLLPALERITFLCAYSTHLFNFLACTVRSLKKTKDTKGVAIFSLAAMKYH